MKNGDMRMHFAGIDIGSCGSKGVIMDDEGKIIASTIIQTGSESVKTAQRVFHRMSAQTGLKLDDMVYIVATGYGRVLVPFSQKNISEISCHARGAHWFYPSVRTILDMGGQDCKAIRCDETGKVINFVMNDKCAGGTGRFLEVIADVLGLPLDEIGKFALESRKAIPFTTICAVFAKSEALSLLKKGAAKQDILAGLNDAIAVRSFNLLKRVYIAEDFTITGGISKNAGMVQKITEKVGIKPLLADDPQLVGAVGAALYARRLYLSDQEKGKA